MKRMLIAVACLCLPSLAASAPPDSTVATSHPNSMQAGAWALQFDVNGDMLSFDSFAGGLSLKRHASPESALRFGVGVGVYDREAQRESSETPDREHLQESQWVRVETIYQRYLDPAAVVSAYWGVGPFAYFDRGKSESATDSTASSAKSTTWNTGVTAIFGAEWFFARQFSLHAEFLASAYYFTEKRESAFSRPGDNFSYDNRSESDGWSVSTANYIRLGLSAYF